MGPRGRGALLHRGAAVDTQFSALFARPFTYDQPRFSYVWADQPSAAVAPINSITRLARGRYQVRFPLLGGGSGAYVPNGDARRCKVVSWGPDAADEAVNVRWSTRLVRSPTLASA